jgi:choline dehydrogenase
LQEHVDVLKVAQHSISQVMALRTKSIWWYAKKTLGFITKHTGLLTTVIAEAGGFIKSDPTLE